VLSHSQAKHLLCGGKVLIDLGLGAEIQSKNPCVTEIEYIKGRGHSLVIDDGWKDVADAALTFVKRFV
jgi:hypothetical protein